MRADAKRVQTEVYKLGSKEEKISYVRDTMEKNPKRVRKSNFIFYGFDNMESISPYDKGKMMPENVVFPLRLADFEGSSSGFQMNQKNFCHIHIKIFGIFQMM